VLLASGETRSRRFIADRLSIVRFRRASLKGATRSGKSAREQGPNPSVTPDTGENLTHIATRCEAEAFPTLTVTLLFPNPLSHPDLSSKTSFEF
jgi:hypothetical protein